MIDGIGGVFLFSQRYKETGGLVSRLSRNSCCGRRQRVQFNLCHV